MGSLVSVIAVTHGLFVVNLRMSQQSFKAWKAISIKS